MSHFLPLKDASQARPIGSLTNGAARVAVVAAWSRTERAMVLVSGAPLSVLKPDALVVELPDGLPVLSPDRHKIKPSQGARFFVTTETFDPLHLLTELDA